MPDLPVMDKRKLLERWLEIDRIRDCDYSERYDVCGEGGLPRDGNSGSGFISVTACELGCYRGNDSWKGN